MMTMFAALFCGCGNSKNNESVKTVNVEEFAEKMAQQDVRLIDVRTPKEYAEGHLAGAENIDVKADDFAERIKDIKGTVAVYCRGGRRSLKAAEQLAKQGCTVYNLDGGILAWQKAGKATTTVETDVFITQSGKLVKIHALMHSSIRIEYDGREIEIDPCSNLRGRTVDYATMPKADIILVTHEHFDHFDTVALRQLDAEETMLLMNQRCVDLYGGDRHSLKNGDRLEFAMCPALYLEVVPAYNTTAEHLQFHPKGRDNGYILTLDGLRIYIAGDTEDIPEMADIKDIDIAFLPCNQPFTMTPEQLVKAAQMVNPKVLFPYHYGETDVRGIPAQLPGIDVRIRHYE